MIARIVNNNDIILSNMTTTEEDVVMERFTVVVNNRFVNQDCGFNGVYKRYDRRRSRLARPFLGELRALCARMDIPLVVKDERPKWTYEVAAQDAITEDFLPGIKLEQYQIDAIKLGCRVEVCIFDILTGGGKCLGKGTPVMMFDGTIKAVEDVVVGDMLMGDDSTARTVLSTCNGVDDLYEVRQKNGDSYVVNSAHILSLMKTPVTRRHDRKKVDTCVLNYVNGSKAFRHFHKGYKAPVDFIDCQEPPFDPYILGVWLGDGVSVDTQFSLCAGPDQQILNYLNEYCDKHGLVIVKYEEKREQSDVYAIRLYEGIHRPSHVEQLKQNPLKLQLRNHDLIGNKHIPSVFKYGSVETRLLLLAGLIDSDGYTNERNDTFYITLKRTKLVNDIVYLARSLGYRVSNRLTYKKWKTDGEGDYYSRITISGDISRIPVKVTSKKGKPRKSPKDPLVYGIEVRPIGRGEYFGFELDGNKRFLLGDFTVTHNTEVMAGLCKAIKCPTVILADQRIVIDQIKQRLELRDVIDEVGLFYAGKTPDGQIIVAGSVQSLSIPSRVPPAPQESDAYRKAKEKIAGNPADYGLDDNCEASDLESAVNTLADKIHTKALTKYESVLKGFRKRKTRAKKFQDIVRKAEMILVDECDLASSSYYRHVFKHLFTGRRRYGFSGTPYDPEKPLEALILNEHLGSPLVQVGRRQLEKLNRIIPIRYTMFVVGETPNERSTFDIAIREKIVENADFHELVARICGQYPDDRTLILVERDALGEALAALIPGSVFIHGKTPKRRRDDVLRAFERKEIRVVIGGKIIRRGLDLKGGCDNLIVATGGKLWSTFNQQIGRAVRINERGYGRVFDFLFMCNKYLYSHSKARLKAIVDMEYKAKVVYTDGQQVDGAALIAARWRKPKPKTQIGRPVGRRKEQRPDQPELF